MTRDGSDWVIDHFAGTARDCTPAPVRDAARVLFAPVSLDAEATRLCASVLSAAELLRAERFLTADGQSHFKQRRAFRRYCGALALGSPDAVAHIEFKETEKGRPYLPQAPEIRFSFSACRLGYLGAWSATHDVGVDIEDQTRNVAGAELAQRYFSKAEAKVVDADGPSQAHTFFQLWTLKEAALKSIGEGLPFGLDAFQFELTPNLRIVQAPRDHGGPQRFQAHMIEGGNRCAAFVSAQRG